jgi:hypothetical protein
MARGREDVQIVQYGHRRWRRISPHRRSRSSGYGASRLTEDTDCVVRRTRANLEMISDPSYQEIAAHRPAAVETSALIATIPWPSVARVRLLSQRWQKLIGGEKFGHGFRVPNTGS